MSAVHLIMPNLQVTACGDSYEIVDWTTEPGRVTCFICRKTEQFKAEQGGRTTDPIPLGQVIAEDEHLTELARRAKERAELEAMKNHRGMFTIKEVIHHGEYYRVRYVEVHSIDATTINAVLMSSPYSYGDWLGGKHTDLKVKEARRGHLDQLVEDLRQRRENRSIGWSTFCLVKVSIITHS